MFATVRYLPVGWGLHYTKEAALQLAMAAGVRRVDAATQYLMLDIDMEVTVENERTILRGVGARLGIEEIAQRAELHPEETAESWKAKYRIHRTGALRPIEHERMAEIVVHINRLERQADSLMFHTSRFMSTVAYTAIHDPCGGVDGANMGVLRDEARRAGYWSALQQHLDTIVQGYRVVLRS